MKPLNALIVVIAVFAFCSLQIQRAKADALDDFLNKPSPKSDFNSFYKDDGSVVNVYGAEESGIVIKDGEVEYYVVPKSDGSPTFVYDDELIVCTSTGCY
jgi:hypothetical protein